MNAIADDERYQVPVYLLSGFLGSGKTTVLRVFLADRTGEGTAVIINDFAELGIDDALVRRRDDDLILLNGGCVCCGARDEFVEALHYLRLRREAGLCPPFRRVVVETTGLADPNPVVHALLSDSRLARHYAHAGVITIVDSTHALGQLERFAEAKRQVVAADYLLLSKTDLSDSKTQEGVTSQLRSLNPTATYLTVRNGMIVAGGVQVSLDQLRSVPSSFQQDVPVWHNSTIATHALEISERLDWFAFCDWLQGVCLAKGRDLLRFKGIVFTKTQLQPIAMHAVHFTIYPPEPIAHANIPADEKSRLIFIGIGLNPDILRRTLNAAIR